MTVGKLYRTLQKLKKEFEYNPYEGRGRNTHCYIILEHKDKEHKFDIRRWSFDKKRYIIRISAVNWTLCAGTCILEWDVCSIKNVKIRVEDVR